SCCCCTSEGQAAPRSPAPTGRGGPPRVPTHRREGGQPLATESARLEVLILRVACGVLSIPWFTRRCERLFDSGTLLPALRHMPVRRASGCAAGPLFHDQKMPQICC